jgi:hypothetical protein
MIVEKHMFQVNNNLENNGYFLCELDSNFLITFQIWLFLNWQKSVFDAEGTILGTEFNRMIKQNVNNKSVCSFHKP